MMESTADFGSIFYLLIADCDVQTIARQGQWLKAVMYKAYLRLFSMPGLLAMGCYPEGQKSNFNTYWAPRFQVPASTPPCVSRPGHTLGAVGLLVYGHARHLGIMLSLLHSVS